MADPVVVAVANVGVALTKVLLRACDSSVGADLVEDGQEFVGILSRALRRTDEPKNQIEHRIGQALMTRTKAMRERCSNQGVDPDLLSGACTEVEIILKEIADDGALLLSAVRSPESFPETLREHAARRRMNVESAAEPYFDELTNAVAAQYGALAPWSPRFQIEAFKSILSGIDEIQENSRRSLDAHAVTHDKLDTLSSKLAAVAHHENKPSRVFFGSRPEVVTGDRFIGRDERKHLNALIVNPTQHRTVLVGMRGCGKTQLATGLAQDCEDANWSLVAWVNAGSPESIKRGLVALAMDLKINTSDQPTQDEVIRRCLNHLKSADAADRLIVFDNVEDINDLRGFVPTGEGLRVVATTTNDTGWEHQDWTTIKVGVFDRSESINYLLTVTKSDDHDSADALAERLGDLPLAIAQAAATARNKDLLLARYLKRLESHGEEPLIRPIPGDEYTDDVATALWMAVEDAVDSMKNGTKQMARRQLGALALLAESGVPTRWLDPTIVQQDNQELHSANQAEDEDAHDALTELIHRSIVQQSTDGSTTILHRLQAQAFRESWAENEAAEAYESAAILLGKVNVDSYPRNDTDSRRRETLDLIEQLRAIGEQTYSQQLLASTQIRFMLNHALTKAYNLDLSRDGITLSSTVLLAAERFASNTEDQLTLLNSLAVVWHFAGYLDVAINMYEENLKKSIDFHGAEHFETLYMHSNLLYAYRTAGRLDEAITQSEQLIKHGTKVLGADHALILTVRNNLASCYELCGQLDRAINLYEQVLDDLVRVQGSHDPKTLATRNNLAGAYESAGRLDEAITLYEQVLPDRIRVLGEDHPDTLTSRNNLAGAYRAVGRLEEAITLYEQVTKDCARILGEDHPLTKTVRKNLEAAQQELAQEKDESPTEESAQED